MANLVSHTNPAGTINNCGLELAGIIAYHVQHATDVQADIL
jgi:hypothetical protein